MRSSRSQVRHGLLIDIGSASVGFAVVTSDSTQKQTTIVWQKRDYVKASKIESVSEALKPLLATLTDMSMSVAQEGLQALREHAGDKAALSDVQVTVSAPWAYTVNRPISFTQKKPFAVTEELIAELEETAGQEAMEQFSKNHPDIASEITETSRTVLETYANGYRLPAINDQMTDSLQINHSISLVNKTLQVALTELQEKLFTDTQVCITSSMIALYHTARTIQPHTHDVCLIDITGEATEIGIVRNGSLTYSTHTAFGTNSLAREFAQGLQRPLGEVTARLGDFVQDTQTADHLKIMDAYQSKLLTLFKETGDSLAIPRNVHILVDENLAATLVPHIKKVTGLASKTSTTVTVLGELLKKKDAVGDVALACSASFFHTLPNQMHFHFI